MASFLSGLVGGYSDAMIKKHQQERNREDQQAQAEIGVLKTAIETGRLTPESQEAAFDRMEEIVSDYGGKKSGFSIKNLVGKFQDVGGSNGGGKKGQSTQGQSSGAAVGGGKQQTTGSGPSPVSSGGRAGAGAGAGAAPPTRGASSTGLKFKSQADMDEEKIQAKIKELHEMAQSYSQDIFGKPLEALSPTEKQTVMRWAYGSLDSKAHPITLKGDKGQPVPALQLDDGSVIGANGMQVDEPEEWKAPKTMESRVNILPDGGLQPVYVDRVSHKVYDANTNEEISKPNLAVPASYLSTDSSSTSVEPSAVADPTAPGGVRIGPAISRQTTTTHSKGGLGGVPARPSSPAKASDAPPARAAATGTKAPASDTKASSNGTKAPASGTDAAPKKTAALPWGQPKNLATQFSQSATEFRQSSTQASKELADAKKALAALTKEKRAEGIIKKAENMATGQSGPNITAAQAVVDAAQKKATNAKRASDFMDQMRESIVAGTVDIDTVQQIARDLAEKGFTTTKPPNVTRQADGSKPKEAP